MVKAIRSFLSYFSNPASEVTLTYHSELIDEDSVIFSVGGEETGLNLSAAAVCTNPVPCYAASTWHDS
jgi:hypothetical protein